MAPFVFYNFDESLLEVTYRGIHVPSHVAHFMANDYMNSTKNVAQKIMLDEKYQYLAELYNYDYDLALHHYLRSVIMRWIDRVYFSGEIEFKKYCRSKHLLPDAALRLLDSDAKMIDETDYGEELQTRFSARSMEPEAKRVRTAKEVYRALDYSNISYDVQMPFRPTIKIRSILLLRKLRYVVNCERIVRRGINAAFKICRVLDWCGNVFTGMGYNMLTTVYSRLVNNKYVERKYGWMFENYLFNYNIFKRVETNTNNIAIHEMETEGGDLTENFEVNKNTAIGVVDTPTVGTAVTIEKPLAQYATSDVISSFSSIQDREFLIGNFEWSSKGLETSDTEAAVCLQYDILSDIMNSLQTNIDKNLTLAPFNYFMYNSFDLEFKIVLNSNKFQFGQLQIAFNYQLQSRPDMTERINSYSISQMFHTLLDAGANNECILNVPYAYFSPLLALHTTSDNYPRMRYGLLLINVLNSLRTIAGPTQCSGSIFIRFTRCDYTGMIDHDWDVHPKAVTDSLSDLDFDNLAFHEMDTILPLVASILDPNRDNASDDTPPRYFVPTMSHSWCIGNGIREPLHPLRLTASCMHPSNVSDANDSMLVANVVRVFGLVKQVEWNTKNNIVEKQLFEIPGCSLWPSDYYNMFKSSGKFNTYAIPPVGVAASNFIFERGTLELRIDVVCSQFHNGRMLIAYVPGWSYSKQTACPLTLSALRNYHHSIISIQDNKKFTFVIPYISNNAVRYVNGTSDATLSVHRSPGMVVCKVLNKLTCVENKNPEVTLNLYLRAGPDFELFVPRQSILFNRNLAITDNSAIYTHPRQSESSWYFGTWHNTGSSAIIRWGTASDQVSEWSSPDGKWYVVVHPDSKDSDRKLIGGVYSGGVSTLIYTCILAPYSNYHIILGCKEEANWSAINTTISAFNFTSYDKLSSAQLSSLTKVLLSASSGGEWFGRRPLLRIWRPTSEQLAYHEGSRVDTGIVVDANSSKVRLESGQFGETFNDFKDYCRRYFFEFDFGFKVTTQQQIGKIAAYLPVLPFMYSPEPIPPNFQYTVTRDNMLTLLSSGYTFFQGGVRKRLLFSTSEDVNLVIEHRPDVFTFSPSIYPSNQPVWSNFESINNNYAYYIQNVKVNPIVEISIPMYNQNALLSTFHGSDGPPSAYTMGTICISPLTLPTRTIDIHCHVYHSFDDDARFHMFQGFPPCAYVSDIVTTQKIAQHEGIFDWAANRSKDAMLETLKPMLEEAKETINNTSTEINKNIMLNLLTNVTHCAIAQDIKSYCVAVVSFCCEIGLLCVSFFQKIVDAFYNMVTSPVGDSVNKVAIGEGEFWDDHFGTIVALLWCSACTILKLTLAPPANLASLCINILGTTGIFVRTSLFLSQLATKFVHLVKYIYKYVSCCGVNGAMLEHVISNDSDILVKWAREVDYLVASERMYMYECDVSMQARVYYCTYFGQYVMSQIVGAEQLHNAKYGPVKLYYDRILKLKEELVAMGKHPNVRRVPFFIWIFGSSGIGKSSAYEKISSELLRAINYRGRGAKTFTYNPISKYWSGCNGQPSMYVDDLFSVSSESTIENQCSMIYQVMTNAVLCPPMAELVEKKLRYAPEILYTNSNVGWVDYNMITDKDAFHRRRDILAEQMLNPEFFTTFNNKYGTSYSCDKFGLKAMAKFIEEQKRKDPNFHNPLQDMDHALYKVYSNPTNPASSYTVMNYIKFMQVTKQMFVRHFRMQKEQFTRACRDEYEFVTNCENDIPALFQDETSLDQISFESILDSKLLQYKEKKKYSFDFTKIKSYFKNKFSNHEGPDSNVEFCEYVEAMHSIDLLNPFFNDILSAPCNYKYYFDQFSKLMNVGSVPFVHVCDATVCLAGCCLYAHTYPDMVGDPRERLSAINKNLFTPDNLDKLELLGFTTMLSVCTFFANLDVDPCSFVDCLNYISQYTRSLILPCISQYPKIKEKLIECPSDKVKNIMNCTFDEKCVILACYSDYHRFFKYGTTSCSTCPDIYNTLVSPALSISTLSEIKTLVKDFLNNCFSWVKNISTALYNVLYKNWRIVKLVLALLGVILASIGGLMVYNSSSSVSSTCPLTQLALEESGPYVASEKSVIQPLKPVALSESSLDQISQLFKCIKRNTVFLIAKFYVNDQLREYKARCLGVSGNKILIIRHYIEEFKLLQNAQFYVRYINNVKTEDYSDVRVELFNYSIKWYKDDTNDYNLGIIDFGNKLPMFRKMENHFLSYGSHSSVGRDGYLYSGDCAAAVQLEFDLDKSWAVAGNKPEISTVNLKQVYKYSRHGAGMCGTLLVSANMCKIVGIHVAGVSGTGLSQPIWSEMFSFSDPEPMVPANLTVGESRFVSTEVLCHGNVSNPYAHAESGVTSIIPSMIHGVFPISTQPAPLTEFDPRLEVAISPKKVGCEKHGLPLYFPRKDFRKRVVADMRDLIMTNVKPIKTVRPLTLEEVVVGLELPHYDGIVLSTSEGFPLMSSRPKRCTGKRYLFDINNNHPRNTLSGIDLKLKTLLDYNDLCRKRNVIPMTVFVDCLKDARIPIHKTKIPGKTRIFSISPVQFTLQFNQLYRDFIASYMSANFRCEHGVGMDVFSDDWTDLANMLRVFPNYCAADYSNFGPSLDMEFASDMLDIIIDWSKFHGMPEEECKKMNVMKYELLCSYHLAGSEIYQVFSGIPSGSPITTPLNSLINSCYIRYKYLELAEEYSPSHCNMKSFRENVKLVTFGDDIVMSVSDEVCEWFNTYTLHMSFKNNGINFTDASKSGTPKAFIPFTEITFLKSYFIPHPNLPNKFLPGLEKYSIEDCCNWVTKKGPRLLNTKINCECALRLAFGWGPEYYKYIYNKIIKSFSKLNQDFSYYSWEELDFKWRNKDIDFFSNIVTP